MNQKNIHWYPGHMKRAFNEIEPRLKVIDVVVEIVDARAPISTKNPFLEEITKNKKRVLVFSKKDLASEEDLKPFIKYYQDKGYVTLPFNVASNEDLAKLKKVISSSGEEKRKKEEKRGMRPQAIRVMVLGIPNVGKSSLINALSGRNSASKANKPGHTRAQQWIRVLKDFELLDTPGILPPHYEDKNLAINMALIGSIPDDILPLSSLCDELLKILLPRYEKEVATRFDLEHVPFDKDELLSLIASKRGLLLKEGKYDLDSAEKLLLKEFKEGKIVKTVVDKLC